MKVSCFTENLLLVLAGYLVSPSISAVPQICRSRLNPDLDNKTTLSWLIQDLLLRNSSSRLECARRCVQEPSCVTFMVDNNRNRCRMYSARITRYNVLLDAPGFRSYDTCRAGNVHGEVCRDDNDCTMLYSVCESNTCQCGYGWRYSPTDLICVKDCIQYGTEFTYFTETFLTITTNAVLKDIKYFSYDACSTACLANAAFVCRSFYLSNNDLSCTLLDTTPEDNQLLGLLSIKVDFYQRQCQYVG
ncbi:hypothetical protein BsWGS_07365 [Bradybaena similaris]